jgi:hypothetical protein
MLLVCCIASAGALTASSSELLTLVKGELRPNSYLLRGSKSSAQRIDDAVQKLERQQKERGSTPSFPRDLMAIDGRWRLVYSSTLALQSPFKQLQLDTPDLPDELLGLLESSPLRPLDVEQRIDVLNRRCVNVVSLAPWPPAEGPAGVLSALPLIGGAITSLQGSKVTLELDHAFSVEGEGGASGGRRQAEAGSEVKLRLEQVRRSLTDAGEEPTEEEPWVDMLNPQVRAEQRKQQEATAREGGGLLLGFRKTQYDIPEPLTPLTAGAFDTSYVDERLRISRGAGAGLSGGSELRVFERVGGGGAAVYASWQEEEDALAAMATAGVQPIESSADGDRWQEGGLAEAEAMDFAGDSDYEIECPDS